MKTYSDLQGIDTQLHLQLQLEPVGSPTVLVSINGIQHNNSILTKPIMINRLLPLLDTINIEIILSDKHYTTEYETAVIIKQLSIDNIDITPKYDYLAEYTNDHHNNNPTSYLGFNGKWRLTFDRPFYHWLHQQSGQGWLIG
jgi:hypothetical protein